jgi:hypothetical protein
MRGRQFSDKEGELFHGVSYKSRELVPWFGCLEIGK